MAVLPFHSRDSVPFVWDPQESTEGDPQESHLGQPVVPWSLPPLSTVPGLEWDQPASKCDAAELPRVPDMVFVLAEGGQMITNRVYQDKHSQISWYLEQT